MLQSRIEQVDAHPFLSCYDIQVLLATTLPDRRYDDEEEVMRQMRLLTAATSAEAMGELR